jgi:hypothetical protein
MVDHISTNTDIATKINILKNIFEKYVNFKGCKTEEELLLTIHYSKLIKWNEISKITNLPEFIMKEFKTKLNWKSICLPKRTY